VPQGKDMIMNFQRKTAIRLFSGLAGSPLARTSETVTPIPASTPSAETVAELSEQILKKKPGPARKYADAAARQRACRERKAQKAVEAAEWQRYQDIIAANHDQKGRLPNEHSGGFDPEKIAQISSAADRAENGRRVRPKGHGLKAHEETPGLDRKGKKIDPETDFTFIDKQKFGLNWKLDESDKKQITFDLAKDVFEVQERSGDTEFAATVTDVGIDHILLKCLLCNQVCNIWLQAAEHVEKHHASVRRRRIRQLTPTRTTAKVSPKYRESEKERIRALSEPVTSMAEE
jgi:hypothetical protein